VELPAGFREAHPPTPFERRVARVVRRIPPGSVASYGAVARLAGRPGAARAVGRALGKSLDVPAQRVVDARGRLAPGWEREQAERLRAEGVAVRDGFVRRPIPWWDG
jgi:methylated-DNA-protein-cysteine methyltransferase-like protein